MLSARKLLITRDGMAGGGDSTLSRISQEHAEGEQGSLVAVLWVGHGATNQVPMVLYRTNT